MADHNDPLTIKEFLDSASEISKRLYPEKQKRNTVNKQECDEPSGHVEMPQYGRFTRNWIKGVRARVVKTFNVTYSMKKPEYLESGWAAVALEDLENNFRQFRELSLTHGIDLTTA